REATPPTARSCRDPLDQREKQPPSRQRQRDHIGSFSTRRDGSCEVDDRDQQPHGKPRTDCADDQEAQDRRRRATPFEASHSPLSETNLSLDQLGRNTAAHDGPLQVLDDRRRPAKDDVRRKYPPNRLCVSKTIPTEILRTLRRVFQHLFALFSSEGLDADSLL